ncbi:hypothetical protein ACOBQJ_03515 [Pelotomaculum propionicicum]|uniref:hypothetical protein n=1 Tax=Pelotomaculum propionicicum TaxID=258475 RepID=UPI003B7B1C02
MPLPYRMNAVVTMMLAKEYDRYIREFVDENRFADGSTPVCLDEFFDNEFQEILKAKKIPRDGGIFLEILWNIEDLKAVFRNRGIKPTKENINAFINSRATKTLEEQSISCGWSVLEDLVSDLQYDGKLPKKTKKAS